MELLLDKLAHAGIVAFVIGPEVVSKGNELAFFGVDIAEALV